MHKKIVHSNFFKHPASIGLQKTRDSKEKYTPLIIILREEGQLLQPNLSLFVRLKFFEYKGQLFILICKKCRGQDLF